MANNLADNLVVKAVDGLDGSGKGSITDEIARKLVESGNDVIIAQLPYYECLTGQLVNKNLNRTLAQLPEDKLAILNSIDFTDLGSEELNVRMTLYALNRLETLSEITTIVKDYRIQNPNETLYILFDRFYTSNVLTYAFIKDNMQQQSGIPFTINDAELKDLFNSMLEIDRKFIEELNLMNVNVNIPYLPYQEVLAAIDNDETRTGRDSYEKPGVQDIANTVYARLAEMSDIPIRLVPQYDSHRRLSPAELAKKIIAEEGIELNSGTKKGKLMRVSRTNFETPKMFISEMRQLVAKLPDKIRNKVILLLELES